VRWILLPAYRVVLMLRLRLGRLALSARGVVFLVFTHRYVLHGVVAALCLVTIATQLQAHEASALDSGQRSLLYSLVTNGQDVVVEEDARPELAQKDANYLGQDTIVSDPGVDYDYATDVSDMPADLTVPGNIALLPGAEQPGAPGDVQVDRTKTENYTIQPGDTISVIASRFGVTVGTVLWANNLTQKSLIKPGLTLKIPPVSGVLHTVAKGDTLQKIASTYDADLNEILAFNHMEAGAKLNPGDELVVPGGTPPAPVVRPIAANPNVSIRPSVPISSITGKALDVYQELTGKDDTRTKPADAPADAVDNVAKGKFLWPTRLHVINQYYGWQHTGVDIDGDYTDPIYAAADGVVETAGWNSGGYGLMILLDHGNGNKTRYGHASKLFVKAGDTVKRGQVMAMIGTTGRSTGTHLHFEVYINNKRVNPLAYIK
jgi:murein DD-endopeptidase MepM/ murein hydrolase activator NlpD